MTTPPSIPSWAIEAAESLVEPVVCANSGGENEYTRLPTISEIAAHLVKLREFWEKGEADDTARLDWMKTEPYERLQKVREWLPISYVPPAPDNLRAAIDNAMKHDPNFRP